MPRPKPGSGQGDAKGACDSIRKEHADIRRAIADYEQRRVAAERQLSGLLQQRNSLLSEQRDVSAALAEARSRSTDPPAFLHVCPSNPKKGRPPGKPDGNEIGCELVGPIIGDEAERFWKRRLEDQKARDIARLEAELRAFPERLSRLDKAIGAAQAAVNDAKSGLHYLYLGLTRAEDEYKSQCGNPRELWPY
jgi:septal ring factor EnvC (AmiA/AmiB activator)